jgi:hypothetical protein
MEIPNRLKLEQSFATRLLGLSTNQRNRLIVLAGYPPDMSKVPESFWQQVEHENREKLAAILFLLWMSSAELHGANVATDIVAHAGRVFAQAHSFRLASQLVENSKKIISAGLSAAGGVTKWEWSDILSKVFGKNRAETIAATETTVAQSMGAEWAIKSMVGLSEQDLWITEADEKVCPVCLPLDQQPRSVWLPQFSNGPPAHVNCRCTIQYANLKEPGSE